MFVEILLFLLGVICLFLGAEMLVKGSSNLALNLGIRPLIVGLTVVALGTSSPELAVSLIAAIQKTKDISIGNILGSNIANIALVIGFAAIIRPLKIQMTTIKREMPLLIMASILFYILSLDHILGRLDGLILLGGFVFFMIYITRLAGKDRNAEKLYTQDIQQSTGITQKSTVKDSLLTVFGLAILIAGSSFIVKSAVSIAEALGVSQVIIGLSIVAIGTSLPELAISGVSAFRDEVDLAVGNAVGSNLFNTLFVIAVVAIIFPIPVEAVLLSFHYPFMIILTILFLPMLRTGFILNRLEGGLLLGIYAVFIYFLFFRGIIPVS